MVRKEKAPEPPQDIPSWFMTYSDVITLLMTFFILLLTFATSEPERFEKIQRSVFGQSGAPGIVGPKVHGVEFDSWAQRVRPRAARIAMNGSEMPPTEQTNSRSVGDGLTAPDEDASKIETMSSHQFVVSLESLIDNKSRITTQGMQILATLAKQLRRLSVNCSIQFSQIEDTERITQLLLYLYDVEKIRPGQAGAALGSDVTTGNVRFVIENFQ